MNYKARLIFLALSLLLLVAIGRTVTEGYEFLLNSFWFTSGFLLLILLSLIDQPHFSKDSSVFINAVTAAVSLLLVNEQNRNYLFWSFFIISFYLAISSYILMWFRQNPLHRENKIMRFFSKINQTVGRPDALFSAFFLWGAVNQFGTNSNGFNALFLYWAVFMILKVNSIASAINQLFEDKEIKISEYVLGSIIGVQSKNTYLAKLLPERKMAVNTLDFVEFIYSEDSIQKINKGLIVDSYFLDEQQWVKILTSSEIDTLFSVNSAHDNHKVNCIGSSAYCVGSVILCTIGTLIYQRGFTRCTNQRLATRFLALNTPGMWLARVSTMSKSGWT